jgi:hypothetical protein
MKFKATTKTIHETQYLHSWHKSNKLQCRLEISRGKKLQLITTTTGDDDEDNNNNNNNVKTVTWQPQQNTTTINTEPQ